VSAAGLRFWRTRISTRRCGQTGKVVSATRDADAGRCLYAATGESLVRFEERRDGWEVAAALPAEGVFSLAPASGDGGTVYVGLRGGGVRRSDDGGASWVDCGLPERDVFSIAVSPANGAVYAGTEPSRLYRSDDRGSSWRALDGLLALPSRPRWSFPPRPWTSHVRAIAPSPHEADVLLVGIELGGLMRSSDGGETWDDHRPGAQPDVHAVAWDPHVPGRAYEAGGGGAAWSEDSGATWVPADEGRDRHYTWALAVDPGDPELWYVSASTGARAAHRGGDPEARIYRRRGSEPWQPLAGGLPDPLPAMPYALAAGRGCLLAGLADGQLWQSGDGGDRWARCVVRGAAPRAIHDLVLAGG
jgi:photosystem II stability/assembly factor-like uncharacterized protein